MSDEQFATQYAGQAFSSDPAQQSMFAWMVFARVNQQKSYSGSTFSAWELWPSNHDTFSPAVAAFKPANKVRTRPHLQAPKISKHLSLLSSPFPSAGEEVTRNMLSYDYIVGKGLNTKVGVWAYLSSSNPTVNLPIGAVEVKGDWANGAITDAYQITDPTTSATYSLVGLHLMVKVAATPQDPFSSETPSWFWTTFEFNNNAGLANARTLITYGNALSVSQSNTLLTQAGLGNSAFTNYSSNGTQIRFSDAQNPTIILGNTKMEGFAGSPNGPSKWTKWNSSCHTCHGEASGKPSSSTTGQFQAFNVSTGKLDLSLFVGYSSLDFIWSIPSKAN